MQSSGRYRHIVFPPDRRVAARLTDLSPLPGSHSSCSIRAELPVDPFANEQLRFLTWLFEQYGLDVRHYRWETLQRRSASCLRRLRVRHFAEARAMMERQPRLLSAALATILIGVTSFFRDESVFQQLRERLLPALAQNKSGLAVWSAGCSDGAELYSVAILLAELGIGGTSYFFGTDCRPDAILRAKEGLFDWTIARTVPPQYRERFFTPEPSGLRIHSQLRHSARWSAANILDGQELGAWDVILCRNTAMYLTQETAARLWIHLEKLLRPGGLLVLGKAERPIGVKRLMPIGSCLYRRVRG